MISEFLLLVFTQLITIFGGFFVFGSVLSFLQNLIQKNYARALGWKGILWTAWIGTPIHELGHIFFAKLFGHRIAKVSLFKPDEETGVLGEVEDTYNPRSIYQNIGNFFVGVGPLIFSSITLAGLLYFLIPNHADIFSALRINEFNFSNILTAIYLTLAQLFAVSNISRVGFWIFLYLSFAIASHMAPSRVDLKRVVGGFMIIVIILILLNLLFVFLGLDIGRIILDSATIANAFLMFFIYAFVVSVVHLFLSLLILTISKLFRA